MPRPFATARRATNLYDTPQWRFLRAEHLRLEPLCRDCRTEGRATAATTVDHVRPHRGDERVFFDAGSLQSLCRRHHNQKTGREVRARIPSRRRPAEVHPGAL